jgi:hypothetical protein
MFGQQKGVNKLLRSFSEFTGKMASTSTPPSPRQLGSVADRGGHRAIGETLRGKFFGESDSRQQIGS